MGIEGGTGDLQQLARPFDVAPALLLRLDERVNVHRVPSAKKAVARLRISTSGVNERRRRGFFPMLLHDRTSFRGRTPHDGCPSKRVRPNYDKKTGEGKTAQGSAADLSSGGSATPSSPASRPTPARPRRPGQTAREGNRGTTLTPARAGSHPERQLLDEPLPDLPPPYGPPPEPRPPRRSQVRRKPGQPIDSNSKEDSICIFCWSSTSRPCGMHNGVFWEHRWLGIGIAFDHQAHTSWQARQQDASRDRRGRVKLLTKRPGYRAVNLHLVRWLAGPPLRPQR